MDDDSEGDANLQLLERPPFNVGYIGFNQAKPPMDKLEVRQAVAHAINRQEVVDTFYGGRGVVATGVHAARRSSARRTTCRSTTTTRRSRSSCSQQAGLTLPVEIDFWYPTDVSRSYMPDPKRNFEAVRSRPERRRASRSCRTARRGALTTSGA